MIQILDFNRLCIVSGTLHDENNNIIWQDEEEISDILGSYIENNSKFNESLQQRKFKFEKDDVMIFLHIQKTSGSNFGRHLVRNLELLENGEIKNRCNKIREKIVGKKGKRKVHKSERWNCHRKVHEFGFNETDLYNKTEGDVWLISRFSTGWKCGTHSDFTELVDCLPGVINDYYQGRKITERWVTIIRNPSDRFISEWKHVQRKATWNGQKLKCGNTSYSGPKEKKNKPEIIDHFFVPKCWTMDKYRMILIVRKLIFRLFLLQNHI